MLAVALLASGCFAKQAYPGERRPAREVATLSTDGVEVTHIDDRRIFAKGHYQRFEILPGPHTLDVLISQTGSGAFGGLAIRYNRRPVRVCLKARAGGHYVVEAEVVDFNRWRPIVIDKDTGATRRRPCSPDDDGDQTNDPKGNVTADEVDQ